MIGGHNTWVGNATAGSRGPTWDCFDEANSTPRRFGDQTETPTRPGRRPSTTVEALVGGSIGELVCEAADTLLTRGNSAMFLGAS